MSSPDLASRIAARNKARVDRLTLDIVERGIDAAIEFALEVIEGKGETGSTYRRLVAQAIAELNPDDPVLWQNYDANMLLREHCALEIEKGDRAFWLQSWNGGEYALNRVTRGSILIPNLSVSLLGGIQPEPFRKAASDMSDDGLIQRLFPIMLGRPSIGKDEPVSGSDAAYCMLIDALHGLRSPKGLSDGSLRFSDAAQRVRRKMEARHLDLQELESINRKLASHIGKYDGYFARLCVIWHCVDYCSDPLGECDRYGIPPEITEDTAQRVADFMHQFLLPHAIAFYAGCLGLSSDHDALESIAGYILAHKLTEVTNRDVQRGDRVMRKLTDFEVKPLLEQLEAMGWLERIPGPRPSSKPQFLVNPRVHEVFAAQAALETERRGKVRELIAQAVRG